MSKPVKFALLFAAVYIAVEIVLVIADQNRDQTIRIIAIGVNMMGLLLAVGASILSNFNSKKHLGVSMIEDLKVGIKSAAIYALIVSAFLFTYYKWVDPEYPEVIMEQRIAYTETEEFKEGIQEQINNNPDYFYGKSAEDIRDNEAEGIGVILDSNKVFLMSLISLLVLGMFYSFAVMALNRLVLAKL